MVLIRDGVFGIHLHDVDFGDLSLKSDLTPPFGGDRIIIYLDTNRDKAADYCFRVYQEHWFLHKSSLPGLFNIHVADGEIAPEPKSSAIPDIQLSSILIPEKINRAWTH